VAKKKNNLLSESTHETRAKFKKTSIGRRPSTAMMNKKKTFKKYVGQGK
jgi:deoxyribose-phosphate aldolase